MIALISLQIERYTPDLTQIAAFDESKRKNVTVRRQRLLCTMVCTSVQECSADYATHPLYFDPFWMSYCTQWSGNMPLYICTTSSCLQGLQKSTPNTQGWYHDYSKMPALTVNFRNVPFLQTKLSIQAIPSGWSTRSGYSYCRRNPRSKETN